jgi:hypothetical protein
MDTHLTSGAQTSSNNPAFCPNDGHVCYVSQATTTTTPYSIIKLRDLERFLRDRHRILNIPSLNVTLQKRETSASLNRGSRPRVGWTRVPAPRYSPGRQLSQNVHSSHSSGSVWECDAVCCEGSDGNIRSHGHGPPSESTRILPTSKQTPRPLVRKRTIPTERPPLVDEI